MQGELVDVLECGKCGARWTNQLMDCYHCAASLNDQLNQTGGKQNGKHG